jgi:hypothetical protein
MEFVFFYLSLSLLFFGGWYIGRRMLDVRDTDAYRLGQREGGDRRFNEGYADGFHAGSTDGFESGYEQGEIYGRSQQEAETLREVGAIEIPYTTDAEN